MNKLTLLTILLVGTLTISACSTSTGSSDQKGGVSSSVSSSVVADDWIKGNQFSGLSIVEYSDFQCPACGSYYPMVKRIMDEFGDKIRFAYRHFPLRNIHPNADVAARAAEASGKQGKFWEMHDLIFERQQEWSKLKSPIKTFLAYAEELDLNVSQFETDLSAPTTKKDVENDFQGGLQLKVNATPSFFISGKKIKNPRSYDDLKALIQTSLNKF